MKKTKTVFLAVLCSVVVGTATQIHALVTWDSTPVFSAGQILPQYLVAGPNHQVEERVVNDGFTNHYKIRSRFGDFDAQSTAELKKRVNEINAMAAMDRVRNSREFAGALRKTGKSVVVGAKNLVTKPVSTLSGAVSGVGRLFRRAGDSLTGDPASQSEDGALKGITGFSRTKRQYASEFGVDVYSSNQALQAKLDEISRASFIGGLTASVALMAIPGGAGVAVSAARGTGTLNEVLRTTPPTDLRRMNREKLKAMGCSPDVIDLFLANTVFSPTYQTLLVGALDGMKHVQGREEFVKMSVLTETDDIAFFRQQQASLYAAYDRNINPIKTFVPVGKLAAAQTVKGTLVFNVPLDHLIWTNAIAKMAQRIDGLVKSTPGVTGKELWVTGTVSNHARNELKKRGWKVQEHAESRLYR